MAVLLLWATKPMLPRALEVTGAWGFTYKTIGFTWTKTTAAGDRFPIGMGFWTPRALSAGNSRRAQAQVGRGR